MFFPKLDQGFAGDDVHEKSISQIEMNNKAEIMIWFCGDSHVGGRQLRPVFKLTVVTQVDNCLDFNEIPHKLLDILCINRSISHTVTG